MGLGLLDYIVFGISFIIISIGLASALVNFYYDNKKERLPTREQLLKKIDDWHNCNNYNDNNEKGRNLK